MFLSAVWNKKIEILYKLQFLMQTYAINFSSLVTTVPFKNNDSIFSALFSVKARKPIA